MLKSLLLSTLFLLSFYFSCEAQQSEVISKIIELVQSDKEFSEFHGEEIIEKKYKTTLGTKHYYIPKANFSNASEYCIYNDEKAFFGESGQHWIYEATVKLKESDDLKSVFDSMVNTLKSKLKNEGYEFLKSEYRAYSSSIDGGRAIFKLKEHGLTDKITISTTYAGGPGIVIVVDKQNEDKK